MIGGNHPISLSSITAFNQTKSKAGKITYKTGNLCNVSAFTSQKTLTLGPVFWYHRVEMYVLSQTLSITMHRHIAQIGLLSRRRNNNCATGWSCCNIFNQTSVAEIYNSISHSPRSHDTIINRYDENTWHLKSEDGIPTGLKLSFIILSDNVS